METSHNGENVKLPALEIVKPVMRLTIETNTLDGSEVRTYAFTMDNCNQEQLAAFRANLSHLLILTGRLPL